MKISEKQLMQLMFMTNAYKEMLVKNTSSLTDEGSTQLSQITALLSTVINQQEDKVHTLEGEN